MVSGLDIVSGILSEICTVIIMYIVGTGLKISGKSIKSSEKMEDY